MSKPIVIAVLSEKGGSGKTNTSIHLARYLMLQGHTVTLLDNDPQGSASYWRKRALDGDNSPTVVHINYPITQNEIAMAGNSDFVVIDGSPGLEADSRLTEMVIFMKQLSRHEDVPDDLKAEIREKLRVLLGPGSEVVAKNSAAIRVADYIIIPASVAEQDTMIAESMIRELIDSEEKDKCMVLLNKARQGGLNNETMYRRRFKAQQMKVIENTILMRTVYDDCYRQGTTVLDSKKDPKAEEETRAAMEEIYKTIRGAE